MKQKNAIHKNKLNSGKTVNRRTFLKGIGTSVLVAGIAPSFVLASSPDEKAPARRAAASRVGAFFNPYLRPWDWDLLQQRQPEQLPMLGSYSGTDEGPLSTQMQWARSMGLDYFMVFYSPRRVADNQDIAKLFDVASRQEFRIALCLDCTSLNRVPDLRAISSRVFAQKSYLRTREGLPLLAILEDGDTFTKKIQGKNGLKAALLSIQSSWGWQPQNGADQSFAKQADVRDIYLGFSLASNGHAEVRETAVLLNAKEQTSAMLVSPGRAKGTALQLPQLSPRRTAEFVILDSFNNWGTSVPLEPSVRFGEKYIPQVRQWARGVVKT